MGKTNKEWHAKNRMPKNPTRDQRVQWHLEHIENCACREMPRDIALEIEKLRRLEIHDKEERDRKGFLRKTLARDETLAWEAEAAGLIGAARNLPKDLSTNPCHFKGFGKGK
jgi:hypothetical protein